METKELTVKWSAKAHDRLKGKTVSRVRYMTDREMNAMGWYNRAVVIEFTDGHWILPSQDDEGNNAGALFTSFGDLHKIPTI